MKPVILALALSLGCCAGAAFAGDEDQTNYPFDPRWAAQEQQREAYINERRAEMNDPRIAAERGDATFYAYPQRQRMQRYQPGVECWNPGANHYEDLRPGPWQGDLDHSRCRQKEGYWRRY